MRIRLLELLPLLLVGVVLLAYQLMHPGTSILQYLPLDTGSATPTVVAVATPRPTAPPAGRSSIASPTPGPVSCTAAKARFVGGILTLKAALGAAMGDPVDCEHVVTDNGDTQQTTTTGLAYYENKINVACFTNGAEHWGLTERGLVHWTGDAIDPPSDAAVVETQ